MMIFHTIRAKEKISSSALARLTSWAVNSSQPVTLYAGEKRTDVKSFREIMNVSFRKGETVSIQVSDTTCEEKIQMLTSILNTYF